MDSQSICHAAGVHYVTEKQGLDCRTDQQNLTKRLLKPSSSGK